MLPRPYFCNETPHELKKRKLGLKLKIRKPFYEIYLKNEIAYTEDHIPVRKLHLFGMPMELTQDALLDYFTQNYGRVLDIERTEASDPTVKEQEYLPTWNAFVLFADVLDAAKVLKCPKRRIRGYRFHVQACYSWLQPVADEESNDLEVATSPSILQLNEDCLEYVFQYLSLADQIRLAGTCTRFRNIYQRLSARQHKSVEYQVIENLTLWEAREFCQLSGHHVESLSCWKSLYNNNFIRCFYAGLHFPNLKVLDVDYKELKVHKLQRILLDTLKLTKLGLKTKPRTDRLELAHLKELKTLKITEWNTESLSLPTSIESLTLNNWKEISCLPSILKGQTQIKKLHVFKSANFLEEMASSQAFASVEVLKISHCHFDKKYLIAQLPRLKKLCLTFNDIDNGFFSEIIMTAPQQLDHLEIWLKDGISKNYILQITNLIGLHTLVLFIPEKIDNEVIWAFGKFTELKRFGLHGSDITDSLVLKLLINCPKLSVLKLENCKNISENLVQGIIRLLRMDIQNGQNQRDLPFKLHLNDFDSRKMRHTDPCLVQVLIHGFEIGEWFKEELKVKN